MSSTVESQSRTRTVRSKKTATSIRRRKSKFVNVQRHKASCGPIAVTNLIKWCGVETSYSKVLQFCLAVQAHHPMRGMLPFQMRYVLRTLRLKFRVRKKFTIGDLDALLASGGACILVYETKRGGHAVFVDSKLENGYRAWNKRKGTPPFFERTEMESAIANSGRRGELYAYTFQRGNNGVQKR